LPTTSGPHSESSRPGRPGSLPQEPDPIKEPEPFWGSDPGRNARLLAADRASFYDPKLPAWFELTIDPKTGRLLALRMTAMAHFMRHRYSGFNAPLKIVPPLATQP